MLLWNVKSTWPSRQQNGPLPLQSVTSKTSFKELLYKILLGGIWFRPCWLLCTPKLTSIHWLLTCDLWVKAYCIVWHLWSSTLKRSISDHSGLFTSPRTPKLTQRRTVTERKCGTKKATDTHRKDTRNEWRAAECTSHFNYSFFDRIMSLITVYIMYNFQ